jgi:hypothetical protein
MTVKFRPEDKVYSYAELACKLRCEIISVASALPQAPFEAGAALRGCHLP